MRKLNMICLVFFVLFSMVSVSYSACEGDLNCDGDVDGSDLAFFAADFGTTGCGNCDDVVARIDELEDRIAQLEALLKNVARKGNDITFSGVNVHIVNGTRSTGGAVNGFGNLIVGYNEMRGSGDDRSGSHNIIVGSQHNYASFGGLLAGYQNTLSAGYASIVAGYGNTAQAPYTGVSGGYNNVADGRYASISGGYSNIVEGQGSSISGGSANTVNGLGASISGGRHNTANGDFSSIVGGGSENAEYGNETFSHYSAILGGKDNTTGDTDSDDPAIAQWSTVSGGYENTASGTYSSVSGGYGNTASGTLSGVSGGSHNMASKYYSSVSGGSYNTANARLSSVSGGYDNTASRDFSSVVGDSGRVYVDSTNVH